MKSAVFVLLSVSLIHAQTVVKSSDGRLRLVTTSKSTGGEYGNLIGTTRVIYQQGAERFNEVLNSQATEWTCIPLRSPGDTSYYLLIGWGGCPPHWILWKAMVIAIDSTRMYMDLPIFPNGGSELSLDCRTTYDEEKWLFDKKNQILTIRFDEESRSLSQAMKLYRADEDPQELWETGRDAIVRLKFTGTRFVVLKHVTK